jgi:hypothetical protein
MIFEWDDKKISRTLLNIMFLCVSSEHAKKAFADKHRLLYLDVDHSTKKEVRFFCYGKIDGDIITVRFTYRNENTRIFGAGYWRKGRKAYEKENNLH